MSLSDFSFDADDIVAARRAVISATTNSVMATWSGIDPTSTLGHTVTAITATRPSTILTVHGPSLADLKFLGVGGTAVVTITLER